jgi:NADPH:quinone reductase
VPTPIAFRRPVEKDMTPKIPNTMRAIALDQFGGPEQLSVRSLPVPEVGPDEVLIRVEVADVAVWDPKEREGELVGLMEHKPQFPYVLGSGGVGTVAAVGAKVDRVKIGAHVYAFGFLNPKGGFYAEYVAVKADDVSPIPGGLSAEQAGAMTSDAITALQGLAGALGLRAGESVLIFGAGGGIGHLAVQLAKRMGARVLAVASGADGVALAERLGADAVVEGRRGDVAAAARAFAPGGVDAALFTAGKGVDGALAAVKDGGRIAYPHGVEPEPKPRAGVTAKAYNGASNPRDIDELNRLIGAGPFVVHVARTFTPDQIAEAHRALGEHYLGKLALRLAS